MRTMSTIYPWPHPHSSLTSESYRQVKAPALCSHPSKSVAPTLSTHPRPHQHLPLSPGQCQDMNPIRIHQCTLAPLTALLRGSPPRCPIMCTRLCRTHPLSQCSPRLPLQFVVFRPELRPVASRKQPRYLSNLSSLSLAPANFPVFNLKVACAQDIRVSLEAPSSPLSRRSKRIRPLVYLSPLPTGKTLLEPFHAKHSHPKAQLYHALPTSSSMDITSAYAQSEYLGLDIGIHRVGGRDTGL